MPIKHAFQSAKGDGGDATQVQPSNWNASHNMDVESFAVHRNGTNQTGATASAYNLIQFTTERLDSHNYFDNATNYRFTPLVAGWYFISLQIAAATGTSGQTPRAGIFFNGSVYTEGPYQSATSFTDFISVTSALIFMDGVDDYVDGRAFLPAAVTTINGATTNTHMQGFLVRGT